MNYDNGIEPDEEYEINNALLAGNQFDIQSMLPEFEGMDEPS